MDFYELINRLKQEGFEIDIRNGKTHTIATINNSHAFVKICIGDCGIKFLNNRIVIDNSLHSDYWINVPISLPFPNSKYQYDFIVIQITFWGSITGSFTRQSSNFEKIREYPLYIYNLR